MSIYVFIVVVQALVAAALVGVILMQRSEGGGLGVGGSPTGLMSARGAASFLTRATAILATIFVVLSITLAAIAASNNSPASTTAPIPAASAPASPAAALPSASPAAPAPSASASAATSPLELPGTNQ